MKRQIPLAPVLAVGLAILVVVGYMLLVKPQRDEAARLDDEIGALEGTLAAARAPSETAAEPPVTIKVADLFRLAKAMPDDEDMPGIILELDSVASAAGVGFVAVQPQTMVAKDAFRVLPVTLTFEGNYYDLTDFLYRLRNLVSVKDGELDAKGRLYTLDAIDMHQSVEGFPEIEAVLTISAYVFGPGAPGELDASGQPVAQPTPTSPGTSTEPGATTEQAPATTEQAPAPAEPAPVPTEPLPVPQQVDGPQALEGAS